MNMLYQSLFEKSTEAILIISPYEDRIVHINPSAARMFSASVETLLAQPVSQVFKPSLAKLVVFTDEIEEKRHAWSNELKILLDDDKSQDVEISAVLLKKSDPVLISFTLYNPQNLQKRRELSEANRLHRDGLQHWQTIENVFREFERENQLILKAVGEGIYGVDIDGNATFVNPAAEKMLGWSASELIGKNMHDLIHHSHDDGSPYHCENCHIYAAFKDGDVRHVDDEQFWSKDGLPFSVEYTSTPIMDNGRLVGAVVIFRDVSQRKLAEEKLHLALKEVQTLKQRLELENAYLQEEYRAEHNYKEIVGKSAAINKIIQQIELVAPTDANVLITGESGTGKELIARAIHESSGRKGRPLIRVNCASIPRELFESEFFGHIKGAFTGALVDRAGRFELADGGSIFLDEVGEIPLELQSKLLRVLQEHQFERVGESKTRSIDVRIIAATNRNLKQEVIEKRFREDLYFRLNVFPIESTALRERKEDIPILANHFLNIACQKFAKLGISLTIGDIQKLSAYNWPGNIRELINVIERAVILSNGNRLELNLPLQQEMPEKDLTNQVGMRIKTVDEMEKLEKQNMINALKMCKGKISGKDGAAALLRMKPTTLSSRLSKLGIQPKSITAEFPAALSS
ncbi:MULTISPECIES: sigma 54-interacting transcriptional regulator [Thiomicrorhabdus]|uniref:Sigma 54-interacting transcriptional regulator n=1 Tax=Thiomicrorhabdus heinhorstiae TaxID=2748010 RepID=A0ABS0BXI6_9GAMM|nr:MULTISPECIES: sigma 54-interacting transcriptional regulator [Thiomicrorhabdus]MBF6058511.1 sigma 54-interacting transcriptional regulator [Thiomicrorhabdus heinhorstiae]